MSIHRVSTWNHNHGLQQELRQAFGHLFQNEVSQGAAGQWAPRVDIHEDEQRFLILADIPGVDPATIEVSMDKGMLIIKGERPAASVEQGGKFTRVERAHGAFQRHFALPDTADAEGISANGKHGVLEISIPKKAQASPRRITIHTNH
ncbi:Hsp20/alpha crystallin family protein [Dyella tabacisoli]|uniref:Hsp20/alpha crystallin family protein n=1 Tax=Dyella tabacisoli TaxID=2282381 RepID=A0A369US91_9GAMM|nr:Hsp20/alpha crystallin family protein [Dyella tabacisoli]RDD81189.1 Hsp20/alpha crystallin family protein [Dyella tabacisoli]